MNTPKIRFKGFTDDWEQRKLGEIALQTYGGGTPKTANEEFWKGNIPWIQSSDLLEERLFNVKPRKYISQEAISKSSTKLVPQNSIAIVTRVGVGKLAFMPFSYATSQDFLSFSELKIEPEFAVYALYKMMRLVSNEVQGTSIKGITKDELLAKEILIPDCEEQKKIGAYLHNLDHLITLHQRKCDETKELKKFMLQKMFPKNGEKNPEIRFEGFTDDWEQRKFEDVGTVAMCKRIFKEQTSEEGEVPFYKIGTFGGIPDAYITRELFEEYKKNYQYPNKGDILISASGSIGRTVEYTGKDEYYQDSNIVWLKHENDLDNSFLKVLYGVIEWSCEGSTIKRLYNDNFLKTEFMLPKIEEQIKIGEYFSKLDHLITLHQRKCEKLKELKKFMLQNMFV